ncbi:MAG: sulfotransferase [Alphaproteobacteria bacterium]|nr:sulfotransferase [Alphaproteobacteria bacterium]
MLAQNLNRPTAAIVLGAALRISGRPAEAIDALATLIADQPQLPAPWFELGLAFGDLGQPAAAIDALWKAVDLRPHDHQYWYALVDQWIIANDPIKLPPHLLPGAKALSDGCLDRAENLFREALKAKEDADSLKLLADTLIRQEKSEEAEALLARCLEIAPDFQAARFRYAAELFAHEKFLKALPQVEELVQRHLTDNLLATMRAQTLAGCWRFADAIPEFERLLFQTPKPGIWLAYGRALRATGQSTKASAAFEAAIEMLPAFSDAYLNLAMVKSFRFSRVLTDTLRAQFARPNTPAQRGRLHFALGKALEDQGEYAESFENYHASNEIQRKNVEYSAAARSNYVHRSQIIFTSAEFARRADNGCKSRAPIFIVGMPRSGSTLLEQILSSHPAVEGVGELPFMNMIASNFDDGKIIGDVRRTYPEFIRTLDAKELVRLGERYIRLSQECRKLDRPHFVDKFPNNFVHIGLIQLVLPCARIIDMRRHPLDCGLSCFKSYFPLGQPFAHRLSDIGRHYADYVELMAHYEDVLPGKVHRVIYERLVTNPEEEVRRLLDFLDLPFEQKCLRFYEQDRMVITLSSEQVRKPLYKDSLEYWRNYEPWLGPLKSSLGQVLDLYPQVPKSFPKPEAEWTISLSNGLAQKTGYSIATRYPSSPR